MGYACRVRSSNVASFFSNLPKSEAAGVAYRPERAQPRDEVEAAARAYEAELLAIDGVEGVGASRGHIVVYVREAAVAERLPERIDGLAVEVVVTGEISAT
jgi:hypothetical protein